MAVFEYANPLEIRNCAMNFPLTPDPIEMELKLGLREITPRQVDLHLSSLEPTVQKAGTSLLENQYFDTPDSLLYALGVALRTRFKKGSYEMTVKIKKPDQGAVSIRQEWNIALPSSVLDYEQLLALPLPELALETIEKRRLGPSFMNKFERTDWCVTLEDTTTIVSLDMGLVKSGNRSSPMFELELELMEGEVDLLVDLGLRLSDKLPSFMAVISKVERGERILRDQAPILDIHPTDRLGWLHRLSRALDPLSGPNPLVAFEALVECGDPIALASFGEPLARGELPFGLARWMVMYSLEICP
jgi:inorganic triphosphatase YgiF